MFLILVLAGAYVTWTMNLWGPIMSMTNAASAQALEEFKKWLRDFLENSETGRQAIAMSGKEDIALQMLGTNGKAMKSAKVGGDAEDDQEVDI